MIRCLGFGHPVRMTERDSGQSMAMAEPGCALVSFTTDYGLQDGFVAACHGVIAGIAPGVRVLDVTHLVDPQAVRSGAEVLAQTVPYLPEAVHLVVVDPGVGTSRRGVVVVAQRGVLVGPDNGVLLPAAEALGGVRSAFELTDQRWWRPEVSRTFHGRDVFAPVAAWLALGVDPAEMGQRIDPGELTVLPPLMSTVDDSGVVAEVAGVDRFGNVQLAAERIPRLWRHGGTLRVRAGDASAAARFRGTFDEAGPQELLVLADSAGRVAIAVNGGSASSRLAVTAGDVIEVRSAD